MIKHILLLCSVTVAGFAESDSLSLEQALELARKNSFELTAMRLHRHSAEKGIAAAGLWANPELTFDAEGLGLDNDLFSEGEYTLTLAQPFQLGGKQKKERAMAFGSVAVADQSLRAADRALTVDVQQAFIEVLAKQEIVKVRTEQEQLGRDFVKAARERHNAGGGSELDVVQAELTLNEILLEQTHGLGELKSAQERLASRIGVPMAELPPVVSTFYELDALDEVAFDEDHPALKQLKAESDRVRAEAQWAAAQDVPDVSLGAGYRHIAADDINTLIFSISMPLSIHKRGRAEQAAAMLQAEALDAEHAAHRRKLTEELATEVARYNGIKAQVEFMKANLKPTAERFCELTHADFVAGRFSWLEQIAARHTLANIRIRYIELLRDAHLVRAQIAQHTKEGI